MSEVDLSGLPVRRYSPESAVRSPRVLIGGMFADLVSSRGLAWRLAVRDITGQYRQSLLGVLWAFILPITNTLVWIFLNGTGIVAVRDTDIPYPAYVFAGTMLWALLSESLNAPLQQCTASKTLLAKINFPREALVLSGILQALFNGTIRMVLVLIALLFLGVYPSWGLLLAPLGVFSLVMTGVAIGLILTPLGMLYTDVSKGIPLLMQLLMYLTPVVFPLPREGWASLIYRANPLTPLILTTRNWLTGGTPEYLGAFAIVTAVMLVMFLAGWIIYRAAMPILTERMSA